MKKLSFLSCEKAVVGVVTAVLIIGLIVAVVSLIQTVYVPKIMEQQEAEHMDEIADQFAWLKSSIDGLIASGNPGIPVVSSITLGSRELPYLLSVRAFGSLEIIEDAVIVRINYGSETEEFILGSIGYNSVNAYFLDQSYIYEIGGVIVSQNDGEMMYIRPSFFNLQGDLEEETLFVNLISISVVGEKSSAAGYGTFPIQTEFNNLDEAIYSSVSSIEIETSYPDPWELYLTNIINRLDLEFAVEKLDTGVRITFNPIDLTIVNIDILAQIGPGWVE